MKKQHLQNIKSILKYIIYAASVVTACYGFWGSFFPDLTLVDGTFCVVRGVEQVTDKEKLYADILDNKVTVIYRSKLWQIITDKYGFDNE